MVDVMQGKGRLAGRLMVDVMQGRAGWQAG